MSSSKEDQDSNGKLESATLKVAEAEQRDVGRKIARVDPDIAKQLGIISGDALELTSLGRKSTGPKLARQGK